MNTDYERPSPRTVEFRPGESTSHCINIPIINNKAFEGNKKFVLRLDLIFSVRVSIDELATVEIVDYNLIAEQNPIRAFDGLTHLINTTTPENTNCSVVSFAVYEGVQCDSADQSLALTLLPCDESIELVVRDENGTVILNKTLPGMPEPQALNYTLNYTLNETETLSVSTQVVNNNGIKFYITGIESSSNLSFPLSAIPLNCSVAATISNSQAASVTSAVIALPLAIALSLSFYPERKN